MRDTSLTIDLSGIHKSYKVGKTAVPVLYDVNLQVASGEFAVIMGPSGGGKTTLLNILGCLDLPDRGEYCFEGERVDNLSSSNIAHLRNRKIGYVFQNFNLFPKMNVFQNGQLPLIYSDLSPSQRKTRVEGLLRKFGLWERRRHLPSEISGGQKQRTAIVRALANNPALILADEPTGNLDTGTTREIMEVFSMLHKEGHTIVLITHDHEVARFGEKLYSLVDGRISLGHAATRP